MEKVRYDPEGKPINGPAMKVRADVMLPNSAMLHAQDTDGTTLGMMTIAWNFSAPDALEKLCAVFGNFVTEFRAAEAAARQAANDSPDPAVQ